jgi:transposase
MCGHEALSLSAVKKWRRRFINDRITLEDYPRSGRLSRSDLYEFLPALVEETPFISCKRMCQKLWIPKTTCLRVLNEDLGFRKCYLMLVQRSMMENKVQCQVTFSEELLQVVCYAKETNFEHLLTDNESSFGYDRPQDSAWAPSRATLPIRKHRKVKPKNAGFPLFGRHPASTVFLTCLPGYGAMRNSFVHLSCLTSKRISATASVRKRFGVSTMSIMDQLTAPKGRGKKLPDQSHQSGSSGLFS